MKMLSGFCALELSNLRLKARVQDLKTTINEQAAEIKKLKILLGEARCSNCYGDGANYDGHGEIHQCQWCDETKKILEV
ncbi:MAG: hypothetical protein GY821_00555 [Gammaproteobacteria bacterium]|nr:hypothetical protein [Gammaproteobacteria bacterium]